MHHPSITRDAANRGFTLGEVMMATVVVLVAVVGLIQAVTVGSEMLDVSRKQTIAMQLIRNEIENVHLKDWATVSAFPTAATITVNNAGNGLQTWTPTATGPTAFALTNFTMATTDDNLKLMDRARNFTCSIAIVTVKTNLLKFTYTVTWMAGNRRKTYTRTGTTYYGKNGLNLYYRR